MELGFLITLGLINNYRDFFTARCYVMLNVRSAGCWFAHVGKLQMSGDTNLCSQLSPLKHLLCYFLSQTPPPSFSASISFKSYVKKHLNLLKESLAQRNKWMSSMSEVLRHAHDMLQTNCIALCNDSHFGWSRDHKKVRQWKGKNNKRNPPFPCCSWAGVGPVGL